MRVVYRFVGSVTSTDDQGRAGRELGKVNPQGGCGDIENYADGEEISDARPVGRSTNQPASDPASELVGHAAPEQGALNLSFFNARRVAIYLRSKKNLGRLREKGGRARTFVWIK